MSLYSYARFCAIREMDAGADVVFRREYMTLRAHLADYGRPETPPRVATFRREEAAALTRSTGGNLLYAGCPPRLVIVTGFSFEKPTGLAWRVENGETLCAENHAANTDLTLCRSEVARLAPELMDCGSDRWIKFEFRKWPTEWSKRPGAVTLGELNEPQD